MKWKVSFMAERELINVPDGEVDTGKIQIDHKVITWV